MAHLSETRQGSATVEVVGLRKNFGPVQAVDGVDLSVRTGEIVSLLGPSGCGKTTTLRSIAGFERPDAGEVRLEGRDITYLAPHRRALGMVFQNYALFPHMRVFDNVAFGLRMRGGRPKSEITRRVRDMLRLVQLDGFEERYPRQLSGGQQQRVALARALAIGPRVLLLDEPLSNLDAKLRQEMRVELKRVLTTTEIATIFVTHDQEEALYLSDRIVLMNQGHIEQEGSPEEIYQRPQTTFAAGFIGQSNFLRGEVVEQRADGRVVLRAGAELICGVACGELRPGMRALATLRQERLRVLSADMRCDPTNTLPARLELLNYLGASIQLVCSSELGLLTALQSAGDGMRPALGAQVVLTWRPEDALVLPDPGSGERPSTDIAEASVDSGRSHG